MRQGAAESKAITYQKSVLGLVIERLQEFQHKPLTKTTCYEIYGAIFSALRDVLETSHAGVTNEFINFVAQHYYDHIVLNENEHLDPNIFTERAKIENLSTGEILLAVPLMVSDVMAENLIRAVKGR
jgi:hypothetical protein